MTQQRLQHYLRTYRRRSGFSQREIAHLLGASSGEKVSRYESFARNPSVVTVFAYEIIFNQPAREIFAGVYDAVRDNVRTRAKRMEKMLAASLADDSRAARKLQLLRDLAAMRN